MSINLAIATIAGGFILPFVIRIAWEPMVKYFGAAGGFMATAFIVGTIWCLNHGIATPLITQSGSAWVDMALAAGVGVFVASVVRGGSVKKAAPHILAAGIAGVIGGLLLSLLL